MGIGMIGGRKKDMSEKKNYQVHIKANGGNVFMRACIGMLLAGIKLGLRWEWGCVGLLLGGLNINLILLLLLVGVWEIEKMLRWVGWE